MGSPFTEWIRKLKKGDQSVFILLYEKTAPGLLKFLLWKTRGDRALSEDILQEAYVRFLLHVDNITAEEEKGVRAYLLQIVKHCFIDKVGRSPHSNKEFVPIDSVANLSFENGDTNQERSIEIRELAIAMENLNERESEIIWLRDALGFSHREVAVQIGMTEQASRQAYMRAKKNLITNLSKRLLPIPSTGAEPYALPEMS